MAKPEFNFEDFEDGDTMNFPIPFAPVSVGSKNKKKTIKGDIQKCVPECPYLLSGDVRMEIEWYVSARRRYEQTVHPDIDNIIKPILDALTGPQGLMIDDNQLQAVGCAWLDVPHLNETLNVELRWSPGDYVEKEGLCFVELGTKLYFPFNSTLPVEANRILLSAVKKQLAAAKEIEDLWGAAHPNAALGRRLMPIQRFFHGGRLEKFVKMTLKEFEETLS